MIEIVIYREDNSIDFGIVKALKKNKLVILNISGKEVSLNPNKVIEKFNSNLQNIESAQSLIRELHNSKNEFKKTIRLEDLYNLVKDVDSLSINEIYDLFFNEIDYSKKAGLFEILINDKVYFDFKENRFLPKSEEEIKRILDSIKAQEENKKEKIETEKNTLEWFKNPTPELPKFVKEYINPIIELAIYPDTKNKSTAIERLEKISAINGFNISGDINYAAFRLCNKLGIFEEDENLLLERYNISKDFNQKTLELAKGISNKKIEIDKRIDLRKLYTFSIDDSSTKDIDDAISIEYKENKTLVYVHIADVEEIMDEELYEIAKDRVSSIYLPDIKIPMLPPIISENICSLIEGEDRYAVTYLFEIDSDFNILSNKILLSVINVDKNFSYEEVENIINSRGPLCDTFDYLYNLSLKLQERRLNAGGIEFAFPSIYPVVDDKNIKLKKFDPFSKSVNIVKELMILANHMSAKFLDENKIPAIYICQESPDVRLNLENRVVKDKVLLLELLKYMKKSYMSSEPRPHFALGLNRYTQATSPIRRLLDLIIQKQIKSFLNNDKFLDEDYIEEIIEVINNKRGIISEIESETNKYWLLKFLLEYKNKKLEGVVIKEINGSYLVEINLTRTVAKIVSKKILEIGQNVEVKLHTIIPRLGIALGNI